MKRHHFVAAGLGLLLTLTTVGIPVRAARADEAIDYDSINKIKNQGLSAANSQVMDVASWLTDVYGPRLAGSPGIQKAGDWAVGKMKEWGLANVRLEPWPADASGGNNGFPRGWTNEKFYLAAVSPSAFPIPGTPTGWTPGTNGLVRGDVVLVTETTEEEIKAKWAGKLRGKWVISQTAPDVQAYWNAPATRQTREDLARMDSPDMPTTFSTQPAAPGGGRGGVLPGGRGGAGGGAPFNRNAFFVAEGVLGTFSTAPRGHGIYTIGGGSRTADPATLLPAIAIPAEQYGRIARMIGKGQTVTVEGDIKNTYTPNPAMFNVIAEIPGTDKAAEVVMLGAHFDSWHASTGATDNAAGSAAMMEAMRILKQSGVRLRRTVRIGLWNGEEEGLIGSRLYVQQVFGGGRAGGGGRGGGGGAAAAAGATGGRGAAPAGAAAPPTQNPTTPAHANFSAYFNIDNGTGSIRGVYLQQNQAVAPIFRQWMEPFRNIGMTTLTPGNTGGTDHQSFDGVGLPGFQFIQDAIEYDTMTHHTNLDSYERLQPEDMRRNATIAAAFAFLAANRDEKLPRKPATAPAGGGRGGN